MTPKKLLLKSVAKKAVEEVGQGSENTEPSFEFKEVFDMDYFAHCQGIIGKQRGL